MLAFTTHYSILSSGYKGARTGVLRVVLATLLLQSAVTTRGLLYHSLREGVCINSIMFSTGGGEKGRVNGESKAEGGTMEVG